MRFLSALSAFLILLFALVLPPSARPGAFQQQDNTDPLQDDRLTRPTLPTNPKGLPDQDPTVRMQKDLEKKANQERQLHLKTDTDKLFKLATELKEQVDKSNQNVLSLEVIKKAEEIEKLAHSVKEKMRGED